MVFPRPFAKHHFVRKESLPGFINVAGDAVVEFGLLGVELPGIFEFFLNTSENNGQECPPVLFNIRLGPLGSEDSF